MTSITGEIPTKFYSLIKTGSTYCELHTGAKSAVYYCLVAYVIGENAIAGDSVSTVEYYDPFAGRWQLASSMCTLRSRVGIAVFKGVYGSYCKQSAHDTENVNSYITDMSIDYYLVGLK